MSDAELLHSTKTLAHREREITLDVLRHLAEVERRKLYCDVATASGLKYGSLFDYAVNELKYSEGAADRRIKAMRLLKELPEVAAKVESGALTLTNIAKAQGFFRDVKRAEPQRIVSREEKVALLEKLEDRSTREGERVLLSMTPANALPKERERQITPDHIELRLVVDQKFKAQLEEARALMGPRGTQMSLVDLMAEVTRLGVEKLREKKFGKRRVQSAEAAPSPMSPPGNRLGSAPTYSGAGVAPQRAARYISQSVKHAVWRAAGGKCSACGSHHNLQYDHIQPVALGGPSTPENLQILCGSCNLRRGVKIFGNAAMKRV